MKRIVFERRQTAYLPEIPAYMDYVNTHVPSWQAFDSAELEHYDPNEYDVAWRFMGTDLNSGGNTVIHDYNSLSTGALPKLKNKIKKLINTKPAARVFLNETVRNDFNFNDGIPSSIRDMGIDERFFAQPKNVKKDYDFVYCGSITHRSEVILNVLNLFKTSLSDARLLFIGSVTDDIIDAFKSVDNITFTGRVPYEEVAGWASRARYGLNLMPDLYPLNVQTATKVVEYCALGLPIITSEYRWIKTFASERNAKFFYLDQDLSNFNMTAVDDFAFNVPNVDDLRWDRLIKSSGVFDILNRL